jgi:hypothetical protein
MPFEGSYNPTDNIFYGFSDNDPGAVLRPFDCASRTFLTDIPLPASFSSNTPGGYAFDPGTGITYAIVANTTAGHPRNILLTLQGGVQTGSTNMTLPMSMHTAKFLFHNGLIYGSNGGIGFLRALDPATGTVANLAYLAPFPATNHGQYRLDGIAWDECRECLTLTLSGNNFFAGTQDGVLAAARFQTDGTIIEGTILYHGRISGVIDTQFWSQCLWSSALNRILSIGNTRLFRF